MPLPAKTSLLVALIITVPVLAAYLGTMHAPFLFDDVAAIVENTSIRKVWDVGTIFSPPAEAGTGGRPLANFTFAVSYATSGFEPLGYHVFNLVIHIFNALLLCGVVRRTLLTPLLREKFGNDALFLAGAVATVWAAHPLLTQAVTYISQRTELLMTFFYLLTIYCFIRGVTGGTRFWHLLAPLACALGTMCKEVIATAPIIVLLYDRTFISGTFFQSLRQRWRLYASLAASWLLLVWLLIGVKSRGVGYDLGVTWFQYALTQSKAVVMYLALCFWPHPLIFDRGPFAVQSLADTLPFVLILVALLGVTVWMLARRSPLGFIGAWFFVILAPTSSVIPIVEAPMAENRPYLPLAGIVVFGVMALQTFSRRGTTRVICALAVVIGVFASAHRNSDYANGVSIWRDTIAKIETNPRAHNNLGVLLENQPESRLEAINHFETALRIKPDYADAHDNLGIMLAAQPGRQDEAIAHYEAALRIRPRHANAHSNLAILLASQPGRQADAIAHYEAALRINPNHAQAHNNLAVILASNPERRADAIRHYEAALQMKPDQAETHNNLANLLAAQPARQADAITHYETALRLNPSLSAAHFNLAALLAGLPGRQADAIAHYEAELRLDPDDADGHQNLAVLLAQQPGRRPEAIAHYEAALRLSPNSARLHFDLAAELEKDPGTQEEAKSHLTTALAIDPEFTAAKEKLHGMRPNR